MAKGREVENGKLQFLGGMLGSLSVLGLLGVPLALSKSKAKSIVGFAIMIGSFAASFAKEAVNALNVKRAKATAEERGVDTSILDNKAGKIREIYKKTDEEYNKNIAK